MQEPIDKRPEIADAQKRARNAFNISIATGIIFVLITAAVMFINRSPKIDVSLLLILFTALAAFCSAWLSRRGKNEIGIALVIAGLLLTIMARVFVQKGLAIPTGVTNVILISTIAFYTLPAKWVGRTIALSFAVSIGTIIADQYTVGIPESAAPETGMIIALVLGAVYLIILGSQFSKFTLGVKLISGFLFLSTVPLILLGLQTYTTSRAILEEQVKASLREDSLSTSAHFESFITNQFSLLTGEASLPNIVQFVALPEAQRRGSTEEANAIAALQTFTRQDQSDIISYALTDINGRILQDTITANVNSTYNDPVFLSRVIQNQQPYLSGVQFPQKSAAPLIYLAAPVKNANGQVIGSILVTYNARILQSILEAGVQNQLSGTSYAFLIDDTYFVNLAHSTKPDLLYKSYLNISDATVSSLQEQNFLPRGTQSSMVVPQMEVVNALRGMGFQAAYQAPSWENNGKLAEFSATRIPNTTWILVMAQPVSAINTLIQSQTRTLVTSSAIIIIFTAVIALLASNFFTSPIVQLTNVAEKISAGDFSQKANVRSNDEIGVLGRTFNTMTTQIQELIENLEKRVETRTAELEQTTLQSEKRARELQTITDISRYISTEKDLEKLLPLITKSVSEQFGFYHVGIFLLSENKKYAVLRAANSPGGQRMLRRQHKLEVGQTGIVGNVTATGIPRIAHDTGADAIYFNNPDLPETRSEMALPLSVHGTVTGALDVQSTRPNAFTDSDITLLSLLADQIATAIENARLLEESQRALAESQSVFREYITEAWQKKTVSGVMGYYHTLAGGQLLTNKIVNEIDVTFEDESNVLGVPIRLRDQVIGTLQIKSKKENKSLSADEVSIVESVAERLGLALDSARLFEETSTRASRERLVTDITAKIRSTNDPQEMIKTAMEELKRALGAQQVEIVPQKIKPMSDR